MARLSVMRLSVVVFVEVLLQLFGLVQGHMEMIQPFPFRSSYNSKNPSYQIDYTNTAPLYSDGSNYPCKGYQNDAGLSPVATYSAGQTYTMKITGGAPHGGGSCQLLLSYDNGATFTVIKSMIGGCPLTTSYQFTVPAAAPSGQALFAWTWFNKIGNREMYMNCALVTIIGPTSTGTLTGPQPFIANLGSGLSSCATKEGDEIVFPKRGDDVVYGGMWNGTYPGSTSYLSSCSYKGQNVDTGNGGVYNGPSTSISSGKTTSTRTSTVYTTTWVYSTSSTKKRIVSSTATSSPLRTTPSSTISSLNTIVKSATSTSSSRTSSTTRSTSNTSNTVNTKPATTTSTTIIYQTTTSKIPTATTTIKIISTTSLKPTTTITTLPTQTACAQGTILCNPLGTSWSLCNDGKYVFMGNVAEGTVCLNGQIARRSDAGSCSAVNQIKCAQDGQSWYMCSQSVWVNMGAVAPGTKCVGGQFVVA